MYWKHRAAPTEPFIAATKVDFSNVQVSQSRCAHYTRLNGYIKLIATPRKRFSCLYPNFFVQRLQGDQLCVLGSVLVFIRPVSTACYNLSFNWIVNNASNRNFERLIRLLRLKYKLEMSTLMVPAP